MFCFHSHDTISDICKDGDVVCKRLSNLRGFVYGCFTHGCRHLHSADNLFDDIALTIMKNLSDMEKLSSLHVHCPHHAKIWEAVYEQLLKSIHLDELCFTIPYKRTQQERGFPLTHIAKSLPRLKKICIVYSKWTMQEYSSEELVKELTEVWQSIWRNKKIGLIHLALDIYADGNKYCWKEFVSTKNYQGNIVTEFVMMLITVILNFKNSEKLKIPLVLRIEIKSVHGHWKRKKCTIPCPTLGANLRALFGSFLELFPNGKAEIQWSTNRQDHNRIEKQLLLMKDKFGQDYTVDHKARGNANKAKGMYDYCRRTAVSVSMCHAHDAGSEWETDCPWCGGGPWT